MKVLEFIEAIRESDEYIETIFTGGSCYKFHLLLKRLWPDCIPVTNKDFDHIGSKIDGVVYDINGVVDWSFYPMSAEEVEEAEEWSFAKRSFLGLGECSFCEEPILI